MSASRRSRRGSKPRHKILKYIFITIIFVVAVTGISAGVFLFKTLSSVPAINFETDFNFSKTTFVYDDQGEIYTSFHGEQDRKEVPLTEIPKHVQQAVIAIEDERFYEHPGVDIRALARAVWKTVTGQRLEGGSTITQQLVKNSILTPERKIKRKLQEQWIAIQLERRLTKDEILELYLNRVFFGHWYYGIETAANEYFGKSVSELTIAEGALLAGLIQTPNYYSPYHNMERAIARRNLVIRKMEELGYISHEEAEQAIAEPIVLAKKEIEPEKQPYPQFTWYMKETAKRLLLEEGVCSTLAEADDLIFKGGLHIYTSLNQKMQQAVEQAVVAGVETMKQNGAPADDPPQIAAIIIDPHTGEVKAAVGDIDIAKNGLKRYAQSKVQTGSSIKPLVVYAPAIAEHGYTAATVVDDAPYYIPEYDYWPGNYGDQFWGLMPVRLALKYSRNIPAVKVFMDIGIRNGIEFAHRLGINNTIHPYPSSALGGSELTLEEMVRAFGVFANKGVLVARKDAGNQWQNIYVREIRDHTGRVLYKAKSKQQIVMDEKSNYVITDILKDVVERYANTRAIGRPAAGKTGTSQGSQYTWFVGYTPQYVGGVWVGYDKYPYPPGEAPASQQKWTEREGLVGSQYAALVWSTMMREALEAVAAPPVDFDKPEGITEPIPISAKSGKLVGELTPRGAMPGFYGRENFVYEEIFVNGTQPTEVDNMWVRTMICKDSHLLATEFCPPESVVPRVRMIRPTQYPLVDGSNEPLPRPLDHIWELPSEACNLHGPIPPGDEEQPGDTEPPGEEDTGEDSDTQEPNTTP